MLESELSKLSLGGAHFHFERQARLGISGIKFCVHEHEHEHEHTHGRSYAQIRDLIGASALSNFVRQKALAIFERIAIAEAKIRRVGRDRRFPRSRRDRLDC